MEENRIQIRTERQKNGSWKAYFPEKPGEYGVAKNSKGAITALLQNNLGVIALSLSRCFDIQCIDNETPAQ